MPINNIMKEAISNKKELIKELNSKLDKIVELELHLQAEERNLLNNTDWKALFQTDKRVTDKQKNAHIDSILKNNQEKLARLKNDVVKIKNNINICDDEINFAKYIIREKELEL